MTRRAHDETEHARATRADLGPLFDGNAALELPPIERRTSVVAHTRRVSGSPLPSEAETRDAELATHEADAAKRQALVYVRGKLLELYRSRVASDREAFITADDADRLLAEWSHCPRLIRELPTQAWRGSIFRGGFVKTGRYIESKRNHGTALPGWKPVL